MQWWGRWGSCNVEDRCSMGGVGVGGIGIVGILVVLVVGWFLGIDILFLVGGMQDGGLGQLCELSQEDQQIGQFVLVVLVDIEEVWVCILLEQIGV